MSAGTSATPPPIHAEQQESNNGSLTAPLSTTTTSASVVSALATGASPASTSTAQVVSTGLPAVAVFQSTVGVGGLLPRPGQG